jgi:hypothetical protein
MLKQALHLGKGRPQIHELGIRFVHVSHRRRLPSVTGPGIISQFASQPVPSLVGTWRDGEELFPELAVTRLGGLVNSSGRQRVGCLVPLLPRRWRWMVPTSAYAKIWQIFGKMVF